LRPKAIRAGGLGALLLGLVCLDLLPPLGLAETVLAVTVLVTRHPLAAWMALVPTGLVLLTAIEIMVSVSGPANPVMWPVAAVSVMVALALLTGLRSRPAPQG
jgi:hypothetical protein